MLLSDVKQEVLSDADKLRKIAAEVADQQHSNQIFNIARRLEVAGCAIQTDELPISVYNNEVPKCTVSSVISH